VGISKNSEGISHESSFIQSEIDLNTSTLGFCPPRPVEHFI